MYIYRGKNFILKGAGEAVYLENWAGIEAYGDASPPAAVALTGTVEATAGTATVTGTGTKFTQELIPGQWVLIDSDVWNVYEIDSDTSLTITDVFTANVTAGTTAYRPQIVTEVDNMRGNLIRGSIIRFPNGNLLTVGQGEVRLNGSTLTASLTASKRLTLAIFDPVSMQYSVFPLGMAVPTLTTVAAVAGGTKNMQAGTYSIRIAASRTTTGGYNNPSEKVEVILATGDMIRITFPVMDTVSGQDSWDVYATQYSQANAGIQGPWYFYGTITTAQVSSAGGTYDIEYNDAEISGNRLLTFNNDPPPDALFVATLQGLPVLLSCNGMGRILSGTVATNGTATVTGTGTTFLTNLNRGQIVYIDSMLYTVLDVTSDTSIDVSPTPAATASGLDISLADTAPGPVIRPAKPAINGANVEAFPASFKVAVDPPENIIGWVRGAAGRIYVLTENYLHLVSSTGNPDLPVTVRPFWRAGFRNPQALLYVNDTLYGYTVTGPTRSIADGDEGIMEHSFAAPVQSVFRNWRPERVRIGYDPKNEAVCFFHSGAGSGSTPRGSECLMYMLRLGKWSPTIIIEDEIENRTVTGVATVAGVMTVLVSGVNYQWDSGANAIGGYITTPFMDAGDPGADKTLTGMQVTGHSANPMNSGIYCSVSGGDIPLTDLQNGTNAASGTLTFPVGTTSRTSLLRRANVPRARLFAARVNLDWLGSGELARLDEIVIRGNVTEKRY